VWLGKTMTPGHRRTLGRAFQIVLTMAAAGFLVWQVHRYDPVTVLDALPSSALFYGLFVGTYLVPPLADYLIYRRLLDLPVSAFPLILRKRVLNEAVLDYSGDLYLYSRLQQLAVAPGRVAATVKDVSLLSGAVSNAVTLLLLLVVTFSGTLKALTGAGVTTAALVMAVVTTVTLLAGMIAFRRRLFAANRRTLGGIAAAHGLRLGLVLALQIAQWSSVLPMVSLSHWLTVMAIWLAMTRIPFLPNRDLLLATAGAGLAGTLGAPAPAVTALFLTAGLLPIAAHGLVLCVPSLKTWHPTPAP